MVAGGDADFGIPPCSRGLVFWNDRFRHPKLAGFGSVLRRARDRYASLRAHSQRHGRLGVLPGRAGQSPDRHLLHRLPAVCPPHADAPALVPGSPHGQNYLL